MSASRRLEELGLKLPSVPTPAGSYIPATRAGSLVFTAGQLPFKDGELHRTGKVGAEVTTGEAMECARLCALNAVAAAAEAAGGIDAIGNVVKVTGFVASSPGFNDQAGVLNGASKLLGEIFGDAGPHARAAVGVAELPLDAPVEVEIVFSLTTTT
jgi:enamine deaminase RidA (YjgF/YER057c/UK114 family)